MASAPAGRPARLRQRPLCAGPVVAAGLCPRASIGGQPGRGPGEPSGAGRAAPGPLCRLRRPRLHRPEHRLPPRRGLRVRARRARCSTEPIHLVFVSTDAGRADRVASAHLVVAGANSQATIVESYVGPGRGRLLHQRRHRGRRSARTRSRPLQGAAGERAGVPHRHAAGPAGPQQQLLVALPSPWAAAWSATRSTPCSTARAANARSTACTWRRPAARRQPHVIDHAKPHCASHELYKGILDGKARGVFNGKIFVRQDAQKTDAKQTNKTLLLSDDATINTKPQLEIYADDVKCTHGATVGQLDDEADLLPALARHRPGGGPQPADLRLRQRHRRPDQGRAAPRSAWKRCCWRRQHLPQDQRSRRGHMSIPTCAPCCPGAARADGARLCSTCSASARTSRSCGRRSTASRWSTSTTPPPRRSRRRSSTPCSRYYDDRQRQRPSRRPPAQRAGHRGLRGRPASRCSTSSTPPDCARSSSSAGTTEAHQPRRPELTAGQHVRRRRRDRHLLRWSTTPTSSPGRCCARRRGPYLRVVPDQRRRRIAARRVREAADAADAAGGRGPRVQLAGHDQPGQARSSSWPTAAACRCWWTAPRRCRTCRSTCASWTATSTPSPATRCTGRPASACCTARPSCWRRCRPTRAAAT